MAELTSVTGRPLKIPGDWMEINGNVYLFDARQGLLLSWISNAPGAGPSKTQTDDRAAGKELLVTAFSVGVIKSWGIS